MSAFARNLETLMRKHNLRQKDIAQVLGISEAAITGWMQGADPRAKYVYALSKRYGCTMESLMDDPTAPLIGAMELAMHRRCWDIVEENARKLQAMEEELAK